MSENLDFRNEAILADESVLERIRIWRAQFVHKHASSPPLVDNDEIRNKAKQAFSSLTSEGYNPWGLFRYMLGVGYE